MTAAQIDRPAYPEGIVVGPCVCGSWPGGECLKCEWRPAKPTAMTADQIAGKLADKEKAVFLHRAAWYEGPGVAYLAAAWIVALAVVIVVLWP